MKLLVAGPTSTKVAGANDVEHGGFRRGARMSLLQSRLVRSPSHSPASIFLASSDPLKVWLSSRAVWSDFFAPA